MEKLNRNLNIIYEDEYVVAINKPANLLTIPDRYNPNLPSLSKLLKAQYGEIFVVHRLDYGTTGVILFARTKEAHFALNEQFHNRQIDKIYSAVLSGVLRQDKMEIDIPLLQSSSKKGGVIPSARGKESLTILKVEKRYRNATLVSARLLTGRQHQLRAHTAAIGHPLLVDDFYGNASDFFVSSLKKRFNLKKGSVETPIISRPTLHSREITFSHITKDRITISADYPKDFSALLQVLDKYASSNQ